MLSAREKTPQHGQLEHYLSRWEKQFEDLAKQQQAIVQDQTKQRSLAADIEKITADLTRQQSLYGDKLLSAMRFGFGGHVETPKK